MKARQQVRMLPDGRRLHLSDGPIDLVIEAVGSQDSVRTAYAAAAARFATVLDELCAELPALRRPARADLCAFSRPVARRMHAAVAPYAADGFITPMAAVAGSVAEEILAAMLAAAPLARASVNNGGDIALHLAPGARTTIGLVDRADFSDGPPRLFGRAVLGAGDPVRGVATSGAGGRSFSLGIADAVTVLARSAGEADAAATIVANAVDLPGHPGIARAPAASLQPDSDLGERLVTRAVPRLRADEIERALEAGAERAQGLLHRGLVCAVALHLQGETRVVGELLAGAVALPPAIPRLEGGYVHA